VLVFNRIYVERNLMMDDGASWAIQVKRVQLRYCVRFLVKLVPFLLRPEKV
jgi:hypothetical protein